MDFAAILHQIDAEIEKLERVREIVAGLSQPIYQEPREPKPAPAPAEAVEPVRTEPRLILLPAKTKRKYGPRVKPVVELPKALAPAPFDKPVFVPRSEVTESAPQATEAAEVKELDPEVLEATFRQNLLGGAA